jgi:FkbM family methyltransferase
MGREPEITSMKYAKAPGRKMACELLRKIANKPFSFEPRKVDKPLILYGAGSLGKMAKEYFERLGIPFLFVVDANPDLHRHDPFWAGINILSTQDVPVEQRECSLLAVCVVTVPFSQVIAPLKEQGWCDVVPFYDIAEAYRDSHPLSNGWHSGVLSEGDIYGIESVLTRWEDDVSRAHHLQFIAWHCLREEWRFDDAPVTTQNRYFIPQVLDILHEHEVFVDVGAHHGEVIKRFRDAVENQFRAIYAIEPDPENLRELERNLQKFSNGNVHLRALAVGKEREYRRFFDGLGYASQFSDLGKNTIEVVTLEDIEIRPTFIKLHLEGYELDVLAGGLQTLTKERPIIAATTYHNRLGLWELPAFLMNHMPDYVSLLRLHSWVGTGSVIYAIPKERI